MTSGDLEAAEIDRGQGPPSVRGLYVLPHGPTYRFDDYRADGEVKRMLLVGKAAVCEIGLPDDTVSEVHCLINRTDPMRVTVRDCASEGGTWLNGARVSDGELREGTVLSVGGTTLVAFGGNGSRDRVVIAATTMQEFVANAIDTYGSVSRAATAIGVPRSTLHSWHHSKKFGGAAATEPIRREEEHMRRHRRLECPEPLRGPGASPCAPADEEPR